MVNGDNGEMKTCGSCKHWAFLMGEAGKCLKITNAGVTSDNRAVVIEGEIGGSYLVTLADFGCILHQPKES